MFQKIGSPLTKSQEIQGKIENAIRKRRFQVGEKLPTEKELCEMFGVSRTALREAVQMLSSQGLISIRKGSGMYVNDFTTQHAGQPMKLFLELNFDKNYVLHLMHARQCLEPQLAMYAAANRSEDDLVEFENILELFEKEKDDFPKLARLDLRFHLKIAEATANPIYSMIMNPLYQMLPKLKTLIVKHVKSKAKYTALYYHTKIYENIKKQDGAAAFDAMKEHLDVAEQDAMMLMEALNDNEKLF